MSEEQALARMEEIVARADWLEWGDLYDMREDLAAALAVLAPGGGAVIGSVRAHGGARGGAHRGARGRVLLRTAYGSERLLLPTSGELLPRIC
jgi:hypothetical protein